MNREKILSILYDLTLTVGNEVRLRPLLTNVLQRLLYHTGFPAGVALLDLALDIEAHQVSARIEAAIGDHRLANRIGQPVSLPRLLVQGPAELLNDTDLAQTLGGGRDYPHCLRLPIDASTTILLLALKPTSTHLPLTQLFQLVLRNLSKAILLCRHYESVTHALESDRDQARSDLHTALERTEQERIFLRNLMDTLPNLVWLKDANGVYLACNRNFERLYGASEAEIVGKSDYDFVDRELADFFRRHDRLAMEKGSPSVNEEVLTFADDGHRELMETTKTPMRDGQGRLIGVLGIAYDITERKRTEERLRQAAKVFANAREGILLSNTSGNILDVNGAFSRITGYSREEVLGRNPRLLKSGRHDAEFYKALWDSLQQEGHWRGEIWNKRKNGEIYPEILTISSIKDEAGETRQYLAMLTDISAQKEQEQQLKHLAHYDALTNLPNRVLLSDRLEREIAHTRRRGQRLALVYLDLDGFKAVNDRHGHPTGDRLLTALANRMKGVLREGDTIARLGGDEFVILMTDLQRKKDALLLLKRILEAASLPVRIDGMVLRVSASLGVTFFPQDQEIEADQLIRQADQAMYQAKLGGRNRYQFFDPKTEHQQRGSLEERDSIRLALEHGEFELHYQPKVNLRSARVVGVEALIRWRHPQRGLLLPGEFLPGIEDHPLILELGNWVIETALTQIGRWQQEGLNMPVSINIASRQLNQSNFADDLHQRLQRHGIGPHLLSLEVQEGSALDDLDNISRLIDACKEMGVGFVLDDFGTGHSSLAFLKRLPVEQLKIDRVFVRGMLTNPDDLAIIEGVIGLAGAFRLEVLAECMESPEQGVMLLQMGCELAQGYAIAHPMPAESLPRWLAHWQPEPAWEVV